MTAASGERLTTAARDVRQGVVRLSRRLRRQPQDHGVTPLGVSVLSRLHQHRALTPRALADVEHVTPQTLTRVLAALEEGGLVTRQGDPADGRQSLLEITPAGLAVLRADSARREEWLATAMATALTPAEQQIVRIAAQLMDRLADE
jgi:DNA-binding MarR family transcriptional regulator